MYIKREWGELYALPINHLKGEDTYFEMAPWIGVRKGKGITQVDQSIMLFDNTNKRFMEIPGGAFLPRVMQYENTDLWPSAQVDKEIIHMESNMNYTFALMKDSGGKVWHSEFIFEIGFFTDSQFLCIQRPGAFRGM